PRLPQYGQPPMADGPATWDAGPPQQSQPPTTGGPAPWGGTPNPFAAPSKPRANAAAAVTAGILALITTAMLVWFAFYDVINLYGPTGRWSSVLLVNVLGGAVGAGLVLVAAGFTFVRRIAGAWTLCTLCGLYVVAILVTAPLLWGTPFGAQLEFVFGFDGGNGVAIALTTIFSILTAIVAAIAGSVKSHEPTTGMPPRP
ncbi:MAG: hypothetical protein ACRD0P_13145, partial [Stackebrandtia sp.]